MHQRFDEVVEFSLLSSSAPSGTVDWHILLLYLALESITVVMSFYCVVFFFCRRKISLIHPFFKFNGIIFLTSNLILQTLYFVLDVFLPNYIPDSTSLIDFILLSLTVICEITFFLSIPAAFYPSFSPGTARMVAQLTTGCALAMFVACLCTSQFAMLHGLLVNTAQMVETIVLAIVFPCDTKLTPRGVYMLTLTFISSIVSYVAFAALMHQENPNLYYLTLYTLEFAVLWMQMLAYLPPVCLVAAKPEQLRRLIEGIYDGETL
eukprot:gnl/Dysnectes_brevis/1731_a1970_2073.p1 GENE.gnl/Dysnectes_brevis/1731_a1970_2073~~gnl/Dysnectes_brevis/1731_a1970_2073.p1  ORF type:complete len:264 (-),score=61.50 gnl/Dysnectes_brevis/1731_a1970_2073:81-872(-)